MGDLAALGIVKCGPGEALGWVLAAILATTMVLLDNQFITSRYLSATQEF